MLCEAARSSLIINGVPSVTECGLNVDWRSTTTVFQLYAFICSEEFCTLCNKKIKLVSLMIKLLRGETTNNKSNYNNDIESNWPATNYYTQQRYYIIIKDRHWYELEVPRFIQFWLIQPFCVKVPFLRIYFVICFATELFSQNISHPSNTGITIW